MRTFPVPGGPARIKLGKLPSFAMAWSRTNVSSLPTIWSKVSGRYFSIHGTWNDIPLFIVDFVPAVLLLVAVVVVGAFAAVVAVDVDSDDWFSLL